MRGVKVVFVFFLLVGISSGSLLGGDETPTDPGAEKRKCETHTIINQPPDASYIITRCGQNSKSNLTDEQLITETSNDQRYGHSQKLRHPFNTFDDLDAQVSMADSTDKIKGYTWWGVVIGVIGLFTLGWTLFETRVVAKATVKAANITATEFKAHLYLFLIPPSGVHRDEILPQRNQFRADEVKEKDKIIIELAIKNYGKTPASKVFIYHKLLSREEMQNDRIAIDFIKEPAIRFADTPFFDICRTPAHIIFPDGKYVSHSERFYVADDQILKGAGYWVRIVFEDIFGQRRYVDACHQFDEYSIDDHSVFSTVSESRIRVSGFPETEEYATRDYEHIKHVNP